MRAKVCIRGRDAELGMFAGASSCCRLGGVDGGWSVGLAGKLRMEKSTPRKSCSERRNAGARRPRAGSRKPE